MPNEVIDAVRHKYPDYKDVSDDKLTLAIGQKYPEYLIRPDFKADFDKVSGVVDQTVNNPMPQEASAMPASGSTPPVVRTSLPASEQAAVDRVGALARASYNAQDHSIAEAAQAIPKFIENPGGALAEGVTGAMNIPAGIHNIIYPNEPWKMPFGAEQNLIPSESIKAITDPITPKGGVIEGFVHKTDEVLSDLTKPSLLVAAPFAASKAPMVAKGVQSVFATQMLANTPAVINKSYETFSNPDATPKDIGSATAEMGSHLLFTAMLTMGHSPEEAAKITEEQVKQTPIYGRDMQIPQGYFAPKETPLEAKAAEIQPLAPLTAEVLKTVAAKEEPAAPTEPKPLQILSAVKDKNGKIAVGDLDEHHSDIVQRLHEAGRIDSPTDFRPDNRGWVAAGMTKADTYVNIEDVQAANGDVELAIRNKIKANENNTAQSTGQTASETALRSEENAAPKSQSNETHPATSNEPAQGGQGGSGALSDYDKFQQLKEQLNKLPLAERFSSDIPKQLEEIKNRNGGMPPKPPEVAHAEPTGSDQYGIAERVRDERAAAGQVEPIPAGEGSSPKELVQRGRDLLASGTDPESVMTNFEKTKQFSSDDMAVARAHGEQLAKNAKALESQFGRKSKEWNDAYDKLSAWDKRTKAMQTESSDTFRAQQGATDIDTGTFTGLRQAYNDSSGKDFTEKQAKEAQIIADANAKTNADLETAKQQLYEAAESAAVDPKVKSIADRIISALDKTANDAYARIQKRRAQGRLYAGLNPLEQADYALWGASKIAKGVIEKSLWLAEMINDFGDGIKPHLDDIWDAANKHLDEVVEKGTSPETKESVSKAIRKTSTPLTIDEIRKTLSEHKEGDKFSPQQVKALWNAAKVYLDKGGEDFHDIRSKLATDLGMTVEEVTKGLSQNQSMKRLADDVWRKQRDARRLKADAKIWLRQQQTPAFVKIPRAIMQEMFNLKVLGHVSVGLGTHSPALFFQPNYWGTFFKNYGRMWKIGLSADAHEVMMQDLMRRDNWTMARRAGLENDPFSHEEYNIKGLIDSLPYLRGLAKGGNRAYDSLKTLRQDVFDSQWDKLPESMQTPEMAKSIADSVNHVTGIVKNKAPLGVFGKAMFAPRLMASRYAWIYGDPVKAAFTGAKILSDVVHGEKTVKPEDLHFAINQVREKATVVGTLLGLLAANQALLSASGSKQKINFDDPTKSDWLKFKAAGMNISFGNAMLTTARLPLREGAILWNNTKFANGKKRFESADRDTYGAIGEYFRNQLNPAVHMATDLFFQNDSQGRPLPWSRQKVPAYLRRQGVTSAYTWSEYTRDATMPIALEESVKQVFKERGMDETEAEKWTKIIGTAVYMGGTGGRMEEDRNLNK